MGTPFEFINVMLRNVREFGSARKLEMKALRTTASRPQVIGEMAHKNPRDRTTELVDLTDKLAQLADLGARIKDAESVLRHASAAALESSNRMIASWNERLQRLAMEAYEIEQKKAEGSSRLLRVISALNERFEGDAWLQDRNAEADLEHAIFAARVLLATMTPAIKRLEEIDAIFEEIAKNGNNGFGGNGKAASNRARVTQPLINLS